mmetsp:Transcript_23453/g.76257  ORF Transcript_23453/g.76257 Transcript_23453/m.76257 type:complete len:113 (+) Transcript_23453:85-423(+)
MTFVYIGWSSRLTYTSSHFTFLLTTDQNKFYAGDGYPFTPLSFRTFVEAYQLEHGDGSSSPLGVKAAVDEWRPRWLAAPAVPWRASPSPPPAPRACACAIPASKVFLPRSTA